MTRHARNLLQIHVAVLLFGFAGLFGKFLTLSPLFLVFARVVLAALALFLAGGLREGPREGLTRRGLLGFAVLGVLLAVHWTTFFQSVQTASVAIALISYSTFPVFVVFLEPLLFAAALRMRHVLLAAAAMAGIALLAPSPRLDDRATQGVLWGVASGGTFAVLSLLNRKQVRRHSSRTIALYQDLFAAVVLLPFVAGNWPALSVRDVLLLLVLGVVCTALAHALFIAGMHGISARTASTIACLEPVYGTLLAAVLLGERPSLRTLLGGAIVLTVALITTLGALAPTGEAPSGTE
jgi:drug/metabolite transporter (DMT)-like permease